MSYKALYHSRKGRADLFGQLKKHQLNYTETHKNLPSDIPLLDEFFEQCYHAES